MNIIFTKEVKLKGRLNEVLKVYQVGDIIPVIEKTECSYLTEFGRIYFYEAEEV